MKHSAIIGPFLLNYYSWNGLSNKLNRLVLQYTAVCFHREDYHQLIFGALTSKPGRLITLPPCIMKPEALWSGKQVRFFASSCFCRMDGFSRFSCPLSSSLGLSILQYSSFYCVDCLVRFFFFSIFKVVMCYYMIGTKSIPAH